ncbi:synaptotagmin C2 domain protein, Syn1 [Rhizophlyctis rosea]|nr:synaptotagmin C2 domain protein, Syn1 [Rhizophlyctis rosea]
MISSRSPKPPPSGVAKDQSRTVQLVVIDGDPSLEHNWAAYFEGCALVDGTAVRVAQCSWLEMECSVFDDNDCLLTITPHARPGLPNPSPAYTIHPDFLLIRNQVRGTRPESDKRNVLYGLMHANIPSINSLESVYMHLERPLMFDALKDIQNRLGSQKFPLIPQSYYSSDLLMVTADCPTVIKISHAHRGMGKILATTYDAFRDITTALALHNDYATTENYVDSEYGLRVQKLGSKYRVYKKMFTGSGWKSHFGGADLEEIPVIDEYRLWVDECAKCFGGMDLLSVDALRGKDGKDYIIEMNGTATGLHPSCVREDSLVIRDLVLERMNRLFVCQD